MGHPNLIFYVGECTYRLISKSYTFGPNGINFDVRLSTHKKSTDYITIIIVIVHRLVTIHVHSIVPYQIRVHVIAHGRHMSHSGDTIHGQCIVNINFHIRKYVVHSPCSIHCI